MQLRERENRFLRFRTMFYLSMPLHQKIKGLTSVRKRRICVIRQTIHSSFDWYMAWQLSTVDKIDGTERGGWGRLTSQQYNSLNRFLIENGVPD